MTLQQTRSFVDFVHGQSCKSVAQGSATTGKGYVLGFRAPVGALHSLLQRLGPALAVSVALSVAASGQQAPYSGNVVTGALSRVGVVNLRQEAMAKSLRSFAPAAIETVQLAPPRLTPAGGYFPAKPPKPALRASASPRISHATAAVASTPALTVVAASGVTGFNALSHLDQRLAYSGNQFSIEPPSPSIAVGNGYVLEGVNDAVQVYDLSGAPLLPTTLASNQVFDLQPAINRAFLIYGVYLTDMRVYFDQGMSRWFIIQRSQDRSAAGAWLASSHLYMAVSQTSDPTGSYNIYVMDTTNPNHSGCPCIADYPQIGSDQYGIHIAWNEFNYSPWTEFYAYVDASVLAVSKSSLAAGATSPTAVQFFLPYVQGGPEFSLQPATTPPGASNFLGSGGLEFFVSTATGSGSQVTLWAMYNTISLSTLNPAPLLIRTAVNTIGYFSPRAAHQPPGATPYGSSLKPPEPLEFLDGGDVRVQSASYASGRLYVTFASGMFDDNGNSVVGGVYVVLSPTYRGGVLAGQVLSQGRLMVNGNDLLRPAIAVNRQGNGAIAVTLTGKDWFPSAALIPFQAGTTPSLLQIAALGAGPEDGFTGYFADGGFGVARWGDYNTAVATADGSIWMVAEYIGPYPRSEFANWNTFVYRIATR